MSMSNMIPDRWLNYKPYGDVIKGTNILAFKVPLKQALVRNLDMQKQFTPSMLRKAFPRLKYIIDLTNTNRYYNKNEFTHAGLTYEKIFVPGRELPPMGSVQKFFEIMDRFRSACRHGELVGVHCTHGVNRTGYLICRYLVQQLGWDSNQSLSAFEKARGYPIERKLYVSTLKNTSQDTRIDARSINAGAVKSERPIDCFWNDDLLPEQPRVEFKIPLPQRRAYVYGLPMGRRISLPYPSPSSPPPPTQRLGFPVPNYPRRKPGPSRVPGPMKLRPQPSSWVAKNRARCNLMGSKNDMLRLWKQQSGRQRTRREFDFTADTFEENLST